MASIRRSSFCVFFTFVNCFKACEVLQQVRMCTAQVWTLEVSVRFLMYLNISQLLCIKSLIKISEVCICSNIQTYDKCLYLHILYTYACMYTYVYEHTHIYMDITRMCVCVHIITWPHDYFEVLFSFPCLHGIFLLLPQRHVKPRK